MVTSARDDFSGIAKELGGGENENDEICISAKIRIMAKAEIAERYTAGERDFSNVVAPNSDFSGMDLRGACFKRAKLVNAVFKNCNLSGADFSFSDLRNANFESAELSGAKFSNADITECAFSGAGMNDADFSNAVRAESPCGADGKRAAMTAEEILQKYRAGRRDFSGVIAPHSDFSGMNLSGIILCGAKLTYSSFNYADLTNADLSNADLTDCAFDCTILISIPARNLPRFSAE